MKHGFPSVLSENGGPGGLSHTLRSIPPMVEVARDVERLAPDAILLNYTNPENRVCLAIERYTSVRSIGLCHGVAETIEFVADTLDMPKDDVDLRAAGVNHFTWTQSLTERPSGRDLLPDLRAALGDDPPEKWRLCTMLYDRFGVFPTTGDNHVGEYIGWAAEIIGTEGYNFRQYARNKGLSNQNLDAWADGSKSVASLLAQRSREARLGHACTDIMAALIAGTSVRRPSFIIRNDGYIENLDRDAVIEVPGLIEDGTFRGMQVGRLAEPVRAMVQHEIEIQKVAVDAAMTGSRDLALQALLIDPCVHSAQRRRGVPRRRARGADESCCRCSGISPKRPAAPGCAASPPPAPPPTPATRPARSPSAGRAAPAPQRPVEAHQRRPLRSRPATSATLRRRASSSAASPPAASPPPHRSSHRPDVTPAPPARTPAPGPRRVPPAPATGSAAGVSSIAGMLADECASAGATSSGSGAEASASASASGSVGRGSASGAAAIAGASRRASLQRWRGG